MNENSDVAKNTLGGMPVRHWLWQILPPVSMLGVFFATRSGTSLVYLVGLLIFPVLFSLISIIAKLVRFRARRNYLLRPLLTIAVFVLIFFIAEWTYRAAQSDTLEIASAIQQQCRKAATCPESPTGWHRDGGGLNRNDLGSWLKYIAIYHPDGDRFRIRLYRGPDTGDVFRGGASHELTVEPYTDG